MGTGTTTKPRPTDPKPPAAMPRPVVLRPREAIGQMVIFGLGPRTARAA
jgi:hypothetical protein